MVMTRSIDFMRAEAVSLENQAARLEAEKKPIAAQVKLNQAADLPRQMEETR